MKKKKKKASLEQAQLVYPFIKSSVGSCRFSGQESDFLFDRKSAMFFFFLLNSQTCWVQFQGEQIECQKKQSDSQACSPPTPTEDRATLKR